MVTFITGNFEHCDVALIATTGFKVIAARTKVAALGPFVGQGEIAGNGHQRMRVFVSTGQWN